MRYRQLLKTYMRHVVKEEGINFLGGSRPPYIGPDDWAVLRDIATKLDAEMQKEHLAKLEAEKARDES